MKKKLLLTSILSIVMCFSLICGATFALFTSESKVNIAVTSGTVSIVATATKTEQGSTTGTANNSFKVVEDGQGGFALTGMVPHDYVNFEIVATNYSDVDIQYRVATELNGGLASALAVTITEKVTNSEDKLLSNTGYTDWRKVDGGHQELGTYIVTITFESQDDPNTAVNEDDLYQGKKANLAFKFEAVQGNAPVVNPIEKVENTTNEYNINDELGMQLLGKFAQTVGAGEGKLVTFNIMKDMNMEGYNWDLNTMWLVINGNGHTISNLTQEGWRAGLFGYGGAVKINNLVLENFNLTGAQVGIIAGAAEGASASNITIKGTNTLTYKKYETSTYSETWNGIGAIFGVTQNSNVENVTIASDAVININYGTMETDAGCKYCDNNAGGTFIQNYSGTVTVETGAQINKTGKVGYPVDISGNEAQDNLSSAINSSTTSAPVVLNLGAGEVKLPSAQGKAVDVTIKGTEDTVIDVTNGAYMDQGKIAFEGVTIKGSTGYANGNGSDYAALYCPNVTYTNCTFVGPFRIGRDGAKFVNCTFTELGNDYVWTYGNDVTFDGCTFETDGKAILIYSDGGNEVSQVTVTGCTFNATKGAKAGAIANQNCAAIEIHNYGNGVNLTTSGNTIDSDFSGEWRIKTYETGKPKVFVNGTEYVGIYVDGEHLFIDKDKNVWKLSKESAEKVVYHDRTGYEKKIQSITVYTAQDLATALELDNAGVFVFNGTNTIYRELHFGADIDFANKSFTGFGGRLHIYGEEKTLSNINFVSTDAVNGKAGLIAYAGDSKIDSLTIKNATATGCQAGIFCGNANNVQITNCNLAGTITINWQDYTNPTSGYHETYNGVGAAVGVYADATTNVLDVNATNATIVINNQGISYEDGKTVESNNLVGVVYGGSYSLT